MIQEKSRYKKYARIGPGGRKCSCCYPPPGPSRRLYEREFKKQDRRESWLEILKELDDVRV